MTTISRYFTNLFCVLITLITITSLEVKAHAKNHLLIQNQDQINSLNEKINSSNDSIGSEFYTIADPEENEGVDARESLNDRQYMDDNQILVFFTPLKLLNSLKPINNKHSKLHRFASEQNLLNWVLHKNQDSEAPEKYQRQTHFGTWIRDPSRQTCLNVRGLVLLRDAIDDDITYADEKHCRITAARWIDPYTRTTLTDAADIQIDHMVPLKNAYISGAWQWNTAQRCNYANFMGNNFHLLAVLGTENNKKSDRTPDQYIPPNDESVCQYLINWLKIKSIWKLKLAKSEAQAIKEELNTYNCQINDFQLDWNELQTQRNKSLDYPDTCNNRGQ